jgi:hypothetical protein
LRRPDLLGLGQPGVNLAQICWRRAGLEFKWADGRGPAVRGSSNPKRYRRSPAVRSSRHRRTRRVFFLRPRGNMVETLAGARGTGAHLRAFPGGEDRSRRSGRGRRPRQGSASMGGAPGSRSARRPWRAPHRACRDLDSGVPGPRERVGLVSYGLGECKQAETEGGEGSDQWHSSPLPCIQN